MEMEQYKTKKSTCKKRNSQIRKLLYKNVPPKIRVMELLQNLRLKCSKMDRSCTKKIRIILKKKKEKKERERERGEQKEDNQPIFV